MSSPGSIVARATSSHSLSISSPTATNKSSIDTSKDNTLLIISVVAVLVFLLAMGGIGICVFGCKRARRRSTKGATTDSWVGKRERDLERLDSSCDHSTARYSEKYQYKAAEPAELESPTLKRSVSRPFDLVPQQYPELESPTVKRPVSRPFVLIPEQHPEPDGVKEIFDTSPGFHSEASVDTFWPPLSDEERANLINPQLSPQMDEPNPINSDARKTAPAPPPRRKR